MNKPGWRVSTSITNAGVGMMYEMFGSYLNARQTSRSTGTSTAGGTFVFATLLCLTAFMRVAFILESENKNMCCNSEYGIDEEVYV